jgi:hypothetical protein
LIFDSLTVDIAVRCAHLWSEFICGELRRVVERIATEYLLVGGRGGLYRLRWKDFSARSWVIYG